MGDLHRPLAVGAVVWTGRMVVTTAADRTAAIA
jgi:hypothetical protein